VGAVGLILYPLLVTAAIGAVQQRNVVHEVLESIDRLVHEQQPQVTASAPPPNTQGVDNSQVPVLGEAISISP